MDAYRKVGRGGSGNFIPKQQAEQAEAKAEDLDLEKLATNATVATTAPGVKDYARAGRGGAGNFVDPASLPGAKEQEAAADRAKDAVKASIARTSKGYSGRGGAGNWTTVKPGEDETEEQDQQLQDELQRRVAEDVEKGLAKPGKAYTQSPTAKEEE